MKTASRASALSRRATILLMVALAVAALIIAFDWNWLRAPLERYAREKSSREVRIADLHVKLGFSLHPTVRLRGLYVENAPWAANRQPMAEAGEASLTFSLRSVWEQRPVITRLVLYDADVDLERRADGLRNWRLVNPDDRSPGRIRILTLDAHRSRIRFIDEFHGVSGVATATPAQATAAAHTDAGLPNRIAYEVTYRGREFSGAALTGAVLSFRESGLSFPLRGHVMAGKTRMDVDGSVADMFDISAMDAKVRIAGPTLPDLRPWLSHRFAVSRPFFAEARVRHDSGVYTAEGLSAKVGSTDISGNASYDRAAERRLLRAELRSSSADLADLAALAGISYPEQRSASQTPPKPPGHDKFRVEGMLSTDAQVTVKIRNLRAPGAPTVENLHVTADLADGVLQVAPAAFAIAGGSMAGSLLFNARQGPSSAQATVDIRGVRLERLFPKLAAKAKSSGEITAQMKLAGSGDTPVAMLSRAQGSLAALLDRGSISNMADAKLGLNTGRMLGLFLRGDREIAVNCGAAAFDIRAGVGRSRAIVLDTEETHVDGSGGFNLRDQQFELLLTPQPKRAGLFRLNSSLELKGSFKPGARAFKHRIVPRVAQAAGSGADRTVFGTLLQAARTRDSPCVALLAPTAVARSSVTAKE